MPVGIVPVVGRRTLAKAKVENPVSGRLYSLIELKPFLLSIMLFTRNLATSIRDIDPFGIPPSLMQWILPLEGSFFKATGRII